jgi:hypothetical protein
MAMTTNWVVLHWITPGGFTDQFADPLRPDGLEIIVERVKYCSSCGGLPVVFEPGKRGLLKSIHSATPRERYLFFPNASQKDSENGSLIRTG